MFMHVNHGPRTDVYTDGLAIDNDTDDVKAGAGVYWGFSFKSTGGVMRDPIYLFDISTAAKFLRDTFKNFDILTKNFAFLQFSSSFQASVTIWRFDRGSSDA
jgi:hypothetical protein